jgi:hypothetical protein
MGMLVKLHHEYWKMTGKWMLVSLLLCVWTSRLGAQSPPLVIDSLAHTQSLSGYLDILHDNSGELSLGEVQQKNSQFEALADYGAIEKKCYLLGSFFYSTSAYTSFRLDDVSGVSKHG